MTKEMAYALESFDYFYGFNHTKYKKQGKVIEQLIHKLKQIVDIPVFDDWRTLKRHSPPIAIFQGNQNLFPQSFFLILIKRSLLERKNEFFNWWSEFFEESGNRFLYQKTRQQVQAFYDKMTGPPPKQPEKKTNIKKRSPLIERFLKYRPRIFFAAATGLFIISFLPSINGFWDVVYQAFAIMNVVYGYSIKKAQKRL